MKNETNKLMIALYGTTLWWMPFQTAAAAAWGPDDVRRTAMPGPVGIGILIGLLLLGGLCVYIAVLRHKHAQRLKKILYSDSKLGIFNQAGFEKAVQGILDHAKDSQFVMIDFDVKHFENYNALFGYEAGDRLLQKVVAVLKEETGNGEVCARITADRFVCLWKAKDIKSRIAAFNDHLQAGQTGSTVFFSFGIYEIKERTIPVSTMIDRALIAKRIVKTRHDILFAGYDEKLHRQMMQENELASRIPEALKHREFEVFYQPKCESRSGRVAGAEALVRWRQPDGTLMLPSMFIPLFERNGTIKELDFYVLQQVCTDLKRSKAMGLEIFPVSVNFSRAHLFDKTFVATLTETLRRRKVRPEFIQVEVTESSVSECGIDFKSIADSLHQAGVTVAVDDFGNGLSSLGMLKEIPADVIKLDRSFINDNCSLEKGKYILESILYVIGKMDAVPVAEGVETEEQLTFLRQCGCDLIQGFYFAGPMPFEKYMEFVKANPESRQANHSCIHGSLLCSAPYGLRETQKLLYAVGQVCSVVIAANITRDRYYFMEKKEEGQSFPQLGSLSSLVEAGEAYLCQQDRNRYRNLFAREHLLQTYLAGEKLLHLDVRLGEDGTSWAGLDLVFVKNIYGEDTQAILFVRRWEAERSRSLVCQSAEKLANSKRKEGR